MATATTSNEGHNTDDTPFPPWLANHLNIEWNSDDIDALLTSIDASQSPDVPKLPHLPAELLLHVLEYVPVAYILDWRVVCRGFRDAIDGRILYHHLQRTRLVGYLGPRNTPSMMTLDDVEYDQLHLMHAYFGCMERAPLLPGQGQDARPVWGSTHAVFNMDSSWWTNYENNKRRHFPTKTDMLKRTSISQIHQGFGALLWAIELDTAVLDLDFPLESSRHNFDVAIDTTRKIVRVEWRPMLFRFLKTERALRRRMESKRDSWFTYSHEEDCLRSIRRERLHAALDPEQQIDRHIKWSLRLLRPLWGNSGPRDTPPLGYVEADAVGLLLLLRRKATLTKRQKDHLHQLAEDFKEMGMAVECLAQSVSNMKKQLLLPQENLMLLDPYSGHFQVSKLPYDPVAWSDPLRTMVETGVQRWRVQRNFIKQIEALMIASEEALAVPEDAFDVTGSEL